MPLKYRSFSQGWRLGEGSAHGKNSEVGLKFGLKRGRLLLPATCLALLFAAGIAVWPQSPAPAFNITLAGQSMIRSDFRVHTPAELATISPLLTGDVIFTNFEATVVEKGQSLHDGRFLSPPEALDALKALGFNLLALSDNHSFDLKVPGIQNTLREVKSRNIAHAGIGNNVEEAAAPGYLHTPKGTVALVAMASGLIAEGGSATATRPGVNELRIEAGGKPNESTTLLPPEPGNEPNAEDKQRILQSIRDARQHADLVIVYEHNHVFLNRPFGALLLEELPERLAPRGLAQKMDARRDRCRRGYHRDAWHASAAWRGDLSRPADLLRSGQLHF